MKLRIAIALATVVTLLMPVLALADDSDQPTLPDGRVVMYRDPVALPASSMALIWLLFIVMAIITLAVLFKSAKRSHLD